MSPRGSIWELAPAQHRPHPLHAEARSFAETNCYVDLWIGILHALRLEVEACLGFGLASDFEGDQWTFVKPFHGDLDRLYGLRVEELALWRSLLEHTVAQVERKRIPLIEMDSFFLPDTRGTDYQRAHVKTTIGVTSIDPEARKLRYFHNSGFFELGGHDFDGLFRLDRPTPDDYLPPYCELVKLDRMIERSTDEARELAREISASHLASRPAKNPVAAYGARMAEHVGWVVAGDEAAYHRYSFASLRQLGSAFEMLASHFRWLDGGRSGDAAQAAEAFGEIPVVAKRLILKLARVAQSKKPADLSSSFESMATAWDRGMDAASRELGP